MRFLRIFGLGRVLAWRIRHVGFAVVFADHRAGLRDGGGIDLHAVGSHIGDEAGSFAANVDAFIKTLRDTHGVGGREAELSAGFLLQRRCRERRLRIAARRLGLNGRDGKVRGFHRLFEIFGLGASADVEPGDLFAVCAHEASLEALTARRGKRRQQRPVFLRDEFFDFEFAVANESQCNRLHAAGRSRAGQLAPQHRGERETDEVIQCAAGHVSIHQRAVDFSRMGHRLCDRLLGNGVEDHALDLLIFEGALFLHDFQDVPRDGFALAIGVGCQDQLVGTLERLGDLVETAGGLGIDLPDHLEIRVRIDRSVLGREVADMTVRGQNLVAGAQIFVDRLGLGRRLDNDEVHLIPITYRGNARRNHRISDGSTAR